MSETPSKKPSRKARIARFWREWWGLVVVALVTLSLTIVFAVLVGIGQLDTGFAEYSPPTPETQQAKTLWDWLDLLLVPYFLGAGAALFTWVTSKRAREAEETRIKEQEGIEERRLKEQRDIELDRSRETALQTYLDRMTELFEKGLRKGEPDDEIRHIARARTLTVLRQLDGQRKGVLLRFLRESELMEEEAIVNLTEADLHEADLGKANLAEADLGRANLQGANLREADLHEADSGKANLAEANQMFPDLLRTVLQGADLYGADLDGIDLQGADLQWAILLRANLFGADLCEANLQGANLREAILQGANLREAILQRADLSRANLQWAYLQGANLQGANLREANLYGANLSEADLSGADLSEANLEGANLTGAMVTDGRLAQTATLEGATLPDGTVYTSEAKPVPTPAEMETDNAEGQPDQPSALGAGEGAEGPTSA